MVSRSSSLRLRVVPAPRNTWEGLQAQGNASEVPRLGISSVTVTGSKRDGGSVDTGLAGGIIEAWFAARIGRKPAPTPQAPQRTEGKSSLTGQPKHSNSHNCAPGQTVRTALPRLSRLAGYNFG